jgi:hypothetical protein
MTIAKNKTTAAVIALFLVLTTAATIIPVLQLGYAAVNISIYKSYVYISVGNSVIGVGQQELIVMWTADMPPDVGEIAAAQGERAAWYNIGINVTKPDGKIEQFIIQKTDPVGGGWILYTPETVGTYYAQAIFPEVWKNTTAAQNHYFAAVSVPVEFTVQQEPIQPWPEAPLPTGYWSRPINDASRNWDVLGGNWLGGAHERPFGTYGGVATRFVGGLGPESAHILWSKPLYLGGYMEEGFGDTGYQTGHYQGMDFTAIIINGKIYYTPRADAHSSEGINVVDLYTGETLQFINQTLPAFGQIYNYESPNQHGGYAYLWRTSGVTIPSINSTGPGASAGTVWQMLDAYTFKSICYVANVSSLAAGGGFFFGGGGGTQVYGLDGSILYYGTTNYGTTANPNYYLQCWNTSAIKDMLATTTGTTAWQWRPSGGGFGGGPSLRSDYYVHNGATGWSLNVSIPTIAGPTNSLLNETGSIRAIREGEYIVIGTAGRNDERGIVPGYMMALSLKDGEEGRKLWDAKFTPPFASQIENLTGGFFFGGGLTLTDVYPEYKMVLYQNTKSLMRWGVSLDTGQVAWTSEPEPAMNYYSMQNNFYNGMLLTTGYGGVVLAYNITTGDIVWNFTAANVGFESPYGNYPINIFAICDGKIYTLTGEHSITQPMWRGPNIRCINASNGVELWNLLGFGANGGAHLTGQYMQLADGKVVGLNFFDNKIYCIGKGNSRTTVSAPQTVPALGSSVMITGTVTDDTPTGSRNTNDKVDFTLKGTPAIDDEYMGRWMEYLFMDQGIPTNAKGVEVTLDTVDPNGNFVHIGTVTSDITGAYGCLFKPEVPGTYQIIATFAGSKSYGASYAQTYLSVGEAPPATAPPPEYPQPIDPTMTIIAVGIAIIIAVAIVGILILRKK